MMGSCLHGLCNPDANVVHLSGSAVLLLEIIVMLLFAAIIYYTAYKGHYKTLRNMGISLVAVLLFEIMIDPIVINKNYSSWTYIFHDITVVLTFGWVILVAAVISLVDFTFSHQSETRRFWYYLVVIDFFAMIFEVLLTKLDMRTYSWSLMNSSYGVFLPFTYVPIGVILAIPVMFALVIAFTKYWENILDESTLLSGNYICESCKKSMTLGVSERYELKEKKRATIKCPNCHKRCVIKMDKRGMQCC